MRARATGDLVAIGVWLIHLSINVIGALIFMLLLKPFSQIVRRIADTIEASPRLTIAVTVLPPDLSIDYNILCIGRPSVRMDRFKCK